MKLLYRTLLALCWLPSAFAVLPPRQFDVATTERLGREMYEQDRRAAIAADLVRDNFDTETERLVGFITVGDPAHLRVRFLRGDAVGYTAAIDAVFDELLLPALERAQNPQLTPAEQAQVKARLQVARDVATRCDGRYNTLALADPQGGDQLIYAIAASADPEKIMVGGHFRFTLSADGETIERTEALATSCAAAPREQLDIAASSNGTAGLAMRTSLGKTPSEIHVFMSLLYETPLFVVTEDLKLWKVEKGHMQVVREKPGAVTP